MRELGEDRRKLRTRTALIKAFSALFLELGYEAVNMAQVAARADIGRSTLYEHFRTKDELLKASLQGPFRPLVDAVDPGADLLPLQGLLEHVRANAAVARVVLAQPVRSRIARLLAEWIGARTGAKGLPQPLVELRAVALAEGQLALIERWIFGPVALAPDAVAEELARLSRAVVAGA
jgi:AcrR family transcriptional regulator